MDAPGDGLLLTPGASWFSQEKRLLFQTDVISMKFFGSNCRHLSRRHRSWNGFGCCVNGGYDWDILSLWKWDNQDSHNYPQKYQSIALTYHSLSAPWTKTYWTCSVLSSPWFHVHTWGMWLPGPVYISSLSFSRGLHRNTSAVRCASVKTVDYKVQA